MTGADLPKAQAALTFAGCRVATLEDIRAGLVVFSGVGGEPADASGHAARAYGSAASSVRAASNGLLRPYRESPSGMAVDLETGRRTRLRAPRSCIDLGDLASFRGRDAACAALSGQIAEAGARPLFVGGGDAAARGLVAGVRVTHSTVGAIEIGDRCLAGRLGFAGPVLSLGISGLQDAGAWRRQIGNGGRIVTAEQLHDNGLNAARDGLSDYSGDDIGPVCILDCRAIDIGYAAGCDSFTVAGLTPEQFISLAGLVGASSPPSAAAVIHLDPARDPRGHMESLIAEALLALFRDTLFEEIEP